MRITPVTITNDLITNLGLDYQFLDTAGNQLATGKRISRPSDDPTNATYSLDMQASIDLNKQYQASAQAGKGWLESTAASLNQLTEIVSRVRTLTVQAANDTTTPDGRQSIANEVQQLLHQVVLVGNQRYGTNYIFGGTAVTAPPFNANGGYSGNTGAIIHQISPAYLMSINTQVSGVFTGAGGIYATISQVLQHLTQNGNPLPPTNSGTETMSLSGNLAANASTTFLVKVNSTTTINTNTYAATASFSTDGGVTWTAATPTGSPPTFALGTTGMTASFTNGAVNPQVGDQFAFTTAGLGTTSANYAITGGTNVGNESAILTGTYAGTGTPQLSFRAAQLDANNNVVGMQMSTDNGTTWSTTMAATNNTGSLPYPTTTTFTLNNGLTLNWTQSTVNAARVAANGDTLSAAPVATSLGNDLTQLDTVSAAITSTVTLNGALQNAIDNTTTQLSAQANTFAHQLSIASDTDIAAVSTQYATAQNLYKAALEVDARSIQPSLMDFLH